MSRTIKERTLFVCGACGLVKLEGSIDASQYWTCNVCQERRRLRDRHPGLASFCEQLEDEQEGVGQ